MHCFSAVSHIDSCCCIFRAAVGSAGNTSITAVTILTSLTAENLKSIGFSKPPLESAVQLAELAVSAGATSIVCSPFEVSAIRKKVEKNIALITPGVRPLGSDLGDQKRVMTPQEAISLGADYVVIGRPITALAKESLISMSQKAKEIYNSLINV